jgi:acetoin utilization protein AcuC
MQKQPVTPVTVVYTDRYLDWQLDNGATDPRRAQIAVQHLRDEMGEALTVLDPMVLDRAEIRQLIESVHDHDFVADVIDNGRSGEFPGASTLLGETAATMFAGTVVAVREVLAGNTRIAFNPQGAKHHARFDHSAGFCVFNDMAWAAREFTAHGHRPLYLDWDVHAGDGVQGMLFDTAIPTLSIHQAAAYPSDPMTKQSAFRGERHEFHHPDHAAYNWNLETGAGDDAFAWALDGAESVIREYKPDVLLLAIGADGHEIVGNLGDTGSRYTYAGFDAAAARIRNLADELDVRGIVIGGAGGYRPLDHTPRIWANVVETLAGMR